jgi:DNA-binding NarL/FixJ family response regulator
MNILLAEDHNIVRNGIKMLLEAGDGYKVVDEAINGREVLEKIDKRCCPDIILTDINMPELDGISLIKEVRLIDPNIKVVMLSMHDNEKYVMQAFIEGAYGYLLKNISSEELLFSLNFIHNGGKYLCAELSMKMLDNLIQHKQYQYTSDINLDFSSREIEILQLIADGLTNNEMAEILFISKRTVEGHRQSLLDKTSSKNTAALIRFAILNGLVQ